MQHSQIIRDAFCFEPLCAVGALLARLPAAFGPLRRMDARRTIRCSYATRSSQPLMAVATPGPAAIRDSPCIRDLNAWIREGVRCEATRVKHDDAVRTDSCVGMYFNPFSQRLLKRDFFFFSKIGFGFKD